MKRILSLFLVFCLSCIVGTIISAAIFMFCADITYLVAGQKLSFFSSSLYIKGVFATFPLVCVISSILIVFYSVRHEFSKRVSFAMFSLFTLLSWTVFIPVAMKGAVKVESYIIVDRYNEGLSTGFFREDIGGIFYYSRILEDNRVDGVFADKYGLTGLPGNITVLRNTPMNTSNSGPYKDVIIKDSVQLSPVVLVPLSIYADLYRRAKHAIKDGWIAWAIFASIGLTYMASFAFINFSSWKLVNIFLISISCAFSTLMNGFYYQDALNGIRLIEMRGDLSQLFSFNDPLIVLMNICFSVVVAAYGIIMAFWRKSHPLRLGEEN